MKFLKVMSAWLEFVSVASKIKIKALKTTYVTFLPSLLSTRSSVFFIMLLNGKTEKNCIGYRRKTQE